MLCWLANFACFLNASQALKQCCILQECIQPVEFTAAKSRLGHGETGAGVMGLLAAATRLGMYACSPLTHLRVINPHVESILAAQKGPGSVRLPRQQAAGVQGKEDGCTGVSAFAFQA